MNHANPTPGLAPSLQPPNTSSNETLPEGIAAVLRLLTILLTYGNHLLATLERRAAQRSFGTIAQCFGTARLPVILARLTRGIRRAMALQRVLLARAVSGNDLAPEPPLPYVHAPDKSSAPASGRQRPSSGTPRPPASEEQRALPTIAQLEAEIRDQPVGQVIADICHDLGISPLRCEDGFRTELHDTMSRYGGDYPQLTADMMLRKLDLLAELAETRPPKLDWPKGDDPTTTRRIVGFLVGEEPVCPCLVANPPPTIEAVAAGPP